MSAPGNQPATPDDQPQPPSSRRRFNVFRKKLKEMPGQAEAEAHERERKTDEQGGADGSPASVPQSEPQKKQEIRRRRRQYLRRYWVWLQPFRWSLTLLFILSAVGTGFGMVQPLFGRFIIDKVMLATGLETSARYVLIGTIAAIMVGLILTGQAIHGYRFYRSLLVNSKIAVRIRRQLFQKMIRLSLRELTDMKVGGAISRLSNDVSALGDLVQMVIITPALALLQLAAMMAIVFTLNWRLALIATTVLPLMALVSYWWLKKGRPIFKALQEDQALVSGRLTETFAGIRVVRAFRREHKEEQDYTVGQHTIVRKTIFAQMRLLWIDMAWMLVMAGSGLLVVGVGALLYIHDAADPAMLPDARTSVGDIFAFQAYTMMVLRPVYMIINTLSQLQHSLAAMERVMDILEKAVDKPDRPGAIPAPKQIDEILLEQVSFGYTPGKPVLRDINLKIRGCTTVALVGKSGAGKTTMTDLIARFHDPDTGAIRINGTDLRDLQLESYRQLLGIVQQDVFLFDGSVRDNLAYGMPHASDEAIREAARRANAHGFISEFEHGYGTIVGERGVKLSGGQRQRLSIARAFLANPRILILDEATSNLDTESEQLIQQSLRELMRDRNTFVIAHRLSTVTYADQIVVLDEGQVVETGSHRELLEMQGRYFEMIDRQRQLTL